MLVLLTVHSGLQNIRLFKLLLNFNYLLLLAFESADPFLPGKYFLILI